MMNGVNGQAKQKSNFSHMKTAILVINSLTKIIPHIREMKSEFVKKFGFNISFFFSALLSFTYLWSDDRHLALFKLLEKTEFLP